MKTYKVVINTCYGGFGLSDAAEKWMKERGYEGDYYRIQRHHPLLIECVETLGSKSSSGSCARLQVEEIYRSSYRISDYDGKEEIEILDVDWVDATDF